VRLHGPFAAGASGASLGRTCARTVTDQIRNLSILAVPTARRRLSTAHTIVDGDDRRADIDRVTSFTSSSVTVPAYGLGSSTSDLEVSTSTRMSLILI
jgi:hypothetical protein